MPVKDSTSGSLLAYKRSGFLFPMRRCCCGTYCSQICGHVKWYTAVLSKDYTYTYSGSSVTIPAGTYTLTYDGADCSFRSPYVISGNRRVCIHLSTMISWGYAACDLQGEYWNGSTWISGTKSTATINRSYWSCMAANVFNYGTSPNNYTITARSA